jgi:hypothetical protein
MRELTARGPWTIRDVHGRCNGDRREVGDYVRRLAKAGYVEAVGEAPGSGTPAVLYTLAKGGQEPPRVREDGTESPPTRRENMWRAMRMIKAFTLTDLVAAASTEEVMISAEDAKDYIRNLTRAKYLRRLPGNLVACWRIINDTGPLPPQVQRIRQVWDPNLRQVMWSAAEKPGGDA